MSPLARGALTFVVVLLSALAFAFRSDDPRRLAFVVYAAPWWLIPTLVAASGAGFLMLLSPSERRPLMRVGGAVALGGVALLGALGLASARTGGVTSALVVLLAIVLGGAAVIAVVVTAIGTGLGDRILRRVLLGGIAVALLVLGFDFVSFRKMAQACARGEPACRDPVRRARGQEEAFRIYADTCSGGGHDRP